jgi:hypothetical protein
MGSFNLLVTATQGLVRPGADQIPIDMRGCADAKI